MSLGRQITNLTKENEKLNAEIERMKAAAAVPAPVPEPEKSATPLSDAYQAIKDPVRRSLFWEQNEAGLKLESKQMMTATKK